ncbi:MAG: EF2563 family selenium-dependent molybdenum hydroxylase system protein [Anaerolineae bacterium]|nr:EF2563 family selenium-dependent molybdenum hydroxylase system protein [Anaerolineae bacterium]
MDLKVLVRGGGDLASGIVLRLAHCGFKILVTELPNPLVVRRTVSFAEAVYNQKIKIEDITGEKIDSLAEVDRCWKNSNIPVLADPDQQVIQQFNPEILVDARMLKRDPLTELNWAPLIIGLGPGFSVNQNCHAVIETKRGPFLGRVLWQGEAEKDTGEPEAVGGYSFDRVIRAPINGVFHESHQISDLVDEGEIIGDVSGFPIRAPFKGVIRGLIHHNVPVNAGLKIGDIDPRCNPQLTKFVSDKALAIGGGVLEAILTKFQKL